MNCRLVVSAGSIILLCAAGTAQVCTIDPCPDIVAEGRIVFGSSYGAATDHSDDDGDGIIDSWLHRVYAAVMCSANLPFKNEAACTYEANFAALRQEGFAASIVPFENLGAVLLSMNSTTQTGSLQFLTTYFGTPTGAYSVVSVSGSEPFAGEGDIDADGVSNAVEAVNVRYRSGTFEDYLAVVLDPELDGAECAAPLSPCPDFVGEAAIIAWGGPEQDRDQNGILDDWDLALAQAVLCSSAYPASTDSTCLFEANLALLRQEPFFVNIEALQHALALGFTLSDEMGAEITQFLIDTFGTPTHSYPVFLVNPGNAGFAAAGDLDLDGTSNWDEAQNVAARGGGAAEYIAAATDPASTGAQCDTPVAPCPDLAMEATLVSLEGDGDDSGIDDEWELALFSAALCESGRPGASEAVCQYIQNLGRLRLEGFYPGLTSIEHLLAAGLSMSSTMREGLLYVIGSFGTVGQTYDVVTRALGEEPFSADGDLDGDGARNRDEYVNVRTVGGGIPQYVAMAMDPLQTGAECDGHLASTPLVVEQGAALTSAFSLDWENGDEDDDGIVDQWEAAAFELVLTDATRPRHVEAVCAFQWNLGSLIVEQPMDGALAQYNDYLAALLTMDSLSQEAILGLFYGSVPAQHPFRLVAPGDAFAPLGDLDSDGVSNQREYENCRATGDVQTYADAVSNPSLDGEECSGVLEGTPAIAAQGQVLYSMLGDDWDTADGNGNGIVDQWEVAVFADALMSSASLYHHDAVCTYRWNRALFLAEAPMDGLFAPFADFVSAALSLSTEAQESALTALYGAVPPDHRYRVVAVDLMAKTPDQPFAADGDLDGDGLDNLAEFQNAVANGLSLEDFVESVQNYLLDGSYPASELPLTGYLCFTVAVALAGLGVRRVRR